MKVPWEDKLPCAALALLVLAVFYGIYFAKMLAQKRRGIQTRQIGRRREKDIHTVEVLMSMATLGAPIAQLLSIAFGWSHLPANARFTGFCIGMLGDAVFLLSVLCMKDSWRAGIPDKDKTELVTTGIYRFSRNPAFLGFDLMYIGVLLLYGNLLHWAFPCLPSSCCICRFYRKSGFWQAPSASPTGNTAAGSFDIWDEERNINEATEKDHLHIPYPAADRPAVSKRALRSVRRRGYERHRLSLPRVGGKVPFRCVAPCKWAGILEADTACLPAIFFRAMNL